MGCNLRSDQSKGLRVVGLNSLDIKNEGGFDGGLGRTLHWCGDEIKGGLNGLVFGKEDMKWSLYKLKEHSAEVVEVLRKALRAQRR